MENTDVNTGAAPSATQTENPYASGRLTKEISQRFQKTAMGETSEPSKAATATADAQEKTVDSEPNGKSASAPDADKSKQESRRKPAAEERISELIAENKRLKEENERSKAKPAETRTESAAVKPEQKMEPPKAAEEPKEPILDDYIKAGKTIDEYDKDMRKYTRDYAKWAADDAVSKDRQAREQEAQQRVLREQLADLNKHIDAAKKKYPNIREELPAFGKAMADADPSVYQAFNRIDNSLFPHVVMVLCSDAAAKEQFLKEAKTDPLAAIERIAVTKKLVQEELSGKGKSKAEKDESEPTKKKDTPAAKATDEPQPTREVGNRGTGPSDLSADAARRGSFRDFDREQKRKAAERFNRS